MTDNLAPPFIFSVETVGRVASRLLTGLHEVHIEAVFASTFYLKSAQFLACVGTNGLEPGPLSIATSAPRDMNWPASGLREEARTRVSGSEIRIGNQFVFRVGRPFVWSPEPIPVPIDPDSVKRGLEVFVDEAPDFLPDEGISRLLDPEYEPGSHHYVCRAARQPLQDARDWLSQEFGGIDPGGHGDVAWVRRLSGLGPGLTPSGDDCLGGMMIALHALDAAVISQSLWRAVGRCVGETRNTVSHGHLSAASEGMCSAGIHRVVSAILIGNVDGVREAFHDIDRIGHTSGWDTMTGVAVTLQVWLARRRELSFN